MNEKVKNFLYGMALGATSFTFLINPRLHNNAKNKEDGISEYWRNVGEYLRHSITECEEVEERQILKINSSE